MKRITAAIIALAVLMSFAACNNGSSDNKEFTVVTTLFPQYDFARAILGEKGSAVLLLTPGADSHNFEITPSNMQTINKSKLFIYTGPQMEIWVDGILPSIDDNVKILDLSCSVHSEAVDHDEDGHNHQDPHIWTSPIIARKMLNMIFDSICAIDPENADYYMENYLKYDAELVKLDSEFRSISNNATEKTLYFSGTFAFKHFVEEYGFSYHAPFNSCSDVHIESVASVNNFIATMKENNAKYVFYQELSQNPILETIVSATGATPLLLHSAHNVSKDDFNNNITYLSIMNANADNLRKALCNE